MIKKSLCFFLILSSCSVQKKESIPYQTIDIAGRDELIAYGQRVRRPVYHAKVPLYWRIESPLETDSLLDTKKPLIRFTLCDQLTLTMHNFPTRSLEERIPLEAHVQRWCQQLPEAEYHIESVSQGGFSGFFLEAEKNGTTLCGWILQLDREHYQTLHFLASTVEEEEHYMQMSADLSLKILGPKELIEKHREAISFFSQSIELIQEIPERL